MNIQTVSINEIKLNGANPRIIKDDKFRKLVKSIKEFPQMLEIRPIVVNAEMVVLGGNMRLRACKEAGLKQVPIIKAEDLTPEQQNEFIIKDNVGFGEWDWEILANEWDQNLLDEWALDLPFVNDDIAQKVNELDEWIGMPEFEAKDEPLKLIINFESEEERDEFVKLKELKIVYKKEKMWTTWWPFKERDDLTSQKYE
jgi:ParB-like chromosome segregation protein Spo0J